MVNVGDKADTVRVAVARGSVKMQPETLALIMEGNMKKGDVLTVAQLAGIMAAKRTSDLVPLCHPMRLTRVDVEFTLDAATSSIHCRAQTETVARTGVEIEALGAVQTCLLTIYDMCKAVSQKMEIKSCKLIQKSGGKSDFSHLESQNT